MIELPALRDALHKIILSAKPLWTQFRNFAGGRGFWVVTATAVVVLGLLLGVGVGRWAVHHKAASVAAVGGQTSSSAGGGDPPATETSQHTVVEDEDGLSAPVKSAEEPPPPPAASPQSAPPPDSAQELAMAHFPPPSALPVPPKGAQPWQKFAVPAPPTGGKPMIAVIIDDMGVDRKRSERVMRLPGPLTISLMSYANDPDEQAAEARAHGHELMMHVPMEPLAEAMDAGPGVLKESLGAEEIRRQFIEDLGNFKGYVGINNHMGSRFTAYAPGMRIVMEELHRRGLLFIDSLTTEHSVGLALAQKAGVPTAGRNVFLDNLGDFAAVEGQLAKLEDVARKKGAAIAIGHPRDATIDALAAWLPTLQEKGFVLVPVTTVVRARNMLSTQPINAAR